MRAVGIVLAGGRSSRMGGGDKPLLPLGGRPLIARVVDRLRGAVEAVAINAGGDPARYAAFGVPVIADTLGGHQGPLAGVLAGLEWAAGRPGTDMLVTLPGDTPFLPPDIASRLLAEAARRPGAVAVARSAGRPHPVCAAWPVSLRATLDRHLAEGSRRVMDFIAARPHRFVDFADPDAFFNVNTPADLAAAEARDRAG